MTDDGHQALVKKVIKENRFLALATTDGTLPWVAPLEYLNDDDGSLYFGSPTSSRHARHIGDTAKVAVAIWNRQQPEFGPDVSTTLNGVQMRAHANQLESEEYPSVVEDYLEEGPEPKMPPYAIYHIKPLQVYVPVVENGVNKRVEVDWPG